MLAYKRLSGHHGKAIILRYLTNNAGCLSTTIGSLSYNATTHCCPAKKKSQTIVSSNHHHHHRYFSSPNLVSPPPPMFEYILQNQFDKVLQRTKTHPHEVSYTHPRGWTALHACAEYGAPLEVVKALLKIHPDAIHIKDWKGLRPVDVALAEDVKDFLEGASVMEDACVHIVNGQQKQPPLDPNVYDDAKTKGILHQHPLNGNDNTTIDTNLLQEVHDFCDSKSGICEENVDSMEQAMNGHDQKIMPSSSSLDPNVYDAAGSMEQHLHDKEKQHMMKQIDLLCLQVNELTNSCHKLGEEVHALKHHFIMQQESNNKQHKEE